MNTYLLPCCDEDGAWIEHLRAQNFAEAEEKFVKIFADDFDFIDYGCRLEDASLALKEHNIIIGDIYDIEEF